jgi:hypothetical protein
VGGCAAASFLHFPKMSRLARQSRASPPSGCPAARCFLELRQTETRTLKEFLQQTAVPHMECPIEDFGRAQIRF